MQRKKADRNADIVVKIPDRCYLSPDPGREFPFPFSFQVTYGVLAENVKVTSGIFGENTGPEKTDEETQADALEGPQIVVSGMEQLMPEDKIGSFLSNLTKEGERWSIRKSASGSDVIMEYAGETPEPDFCFTASTEKFLCEAKEKGAVILKVQVRNFPEIQDYSYNLTTVVAYAPWAKRIAFSPGAVKIPAQAEVYYEYDGDYTDKRLWQDDEQVMTARSPYTALIERPCLFGLEVFNDRGISDTLQASIEVLPPRILEFSSESLFFSEGQAVRLKWKAESVSGISLDGFIEGTDEKTEDGAIVHPSSRAGKTVSYTLRAAGYQNGHPHIESSRIDLLKTGWNKAGTVSGYFAGDVYGNTSYNGRLFWHEENLYCYAHPYLYRSADGRSWEAAAHNDSCSSEFSCLAADYFDGILYVMGKQTDVLYLSSCDFSTGQFSCAPAGQRCSSDAGCFAFSERRKAYCQVLPKGLQISSEENGRWNGASSVVKAEEGMSVLSGDYCFFKDNFYAVMLCQAQNGGQKKLYVYRCGNGAEEAQYVWDAGAKDCFVCLVPAENELYILTDSVIAGYRQGTAVDPYVPPVPAGSRPWFGRGRGSSLTAVYPDKNLWNYL